MYTLHRILPRWAARSGAGRDSALSSTLQTRIEVCPPALWPSSLTLWGRAKRWFDRSAWTPSEQRPVNRLSQVKAEFRRSLGDLPRDLPGGDVTALAERIDRARSLRELWHLRSTLYGLLAVALNQAEAELRMARLNRHFPVRAPRQGAASQIL